MSAVLSEAAASTFPSFPVAIDNTIRTAFKACNRKGFIRFLLERGPMLPSIHLTAGQAFAKGLEVVRKSYFLEGHGADASVERGWVALHEAWHDWDPTLHVTGSAKNKTPTRMGMALVDYFQEYPLESDTIRPADTGHGPAIEFNFSIPLPIPHPQTGDPLIYCGRFDMLGDVGGQLYVVDEKTTGSLGDYWARRYELSSQFTGYVWAAQQYGYPVIGAIIRGIGILSKEIKHAAVPLMRPDFMVQEWYLQMLKDVNRMVDAWRGCAEHGQDPWQTFEPDFADACGAYGGCEYQSVCSSDPRMRDRILAANFAHKEWKPLHFSAGEDE